MRKLRQGKMTYPRPCCCELGQAEVENENRLLKEKQLTDHQHCMQLSPLASDAICAEVAETRLPRPGNMKPEDGLQRR